MLSNFSFVIEGVLAGCAHPATLGELHKALLELREKGIRAIVSLDEAGLPVHLTSEFGFDYLHLPMPDFGIPTIGQARDFVHFVRRERELHRPVVVHCRAGYGRTGTMLALYLVAQGTPPEEAIRQVRTLRPGSIETREQEAFVRRFANLAHQNGQSGPDFADTP